MANDWLMSALAAQDAYRGDEPAWPPTPEQYGPPTQWQMGQLAAQRGTIDPGQATGKMGSLVAMARAGDVAGPVLGGIAHGVVDELKTPGAMFAQNPYDRNTDTEAWQSFEDSKYKMAAPWARGMALNTMGTGAIAGVPARAGEVVLGAGAVRPVYKAPESMGGGRMGAVADPYAWIPSERPQANLMVRWNTGEPELAVSGAGGHGFSSSKTGVPVEEARFTVRNPVSAENPRTFDIEELQRRNAALILAGHDRTMGGGELISAGGRTFKRPVPLEAGVNYPTVHEGKVLRPDDPAAAVLFANAPGPASKFVNEARRAQEAGYDPYLAGVLMNKTGGDSSKQMARTVHEAVRVAPIDKSTAQTMNDSVLTQLKQVPGEGLPFPGVKSRELGDWIDSVGGSRRSAFVKALDQARFAKATGLDVGELRIANTNPLLLNTPTGSVGRLVGKMRPEAGTEKADLHSTYGTSFFGDKGEIGQLQGSVPFHLIAPDVHRGLMRSGPPERFANVPAYYSTLEMPKGVSRIQPVTDEVVENVKNFYSRFPKGWAVPATAGPLSGLAALDQYGRQP